MKEVLKIIFVFAANDGKKYLIEIDFLRYQISCGDLFTIHYDYFIIMQISYMKYYSFDELKELHIQYVKDQY